MRYSNLRKVIARVLTLGSQALSAGLGSGYSVKLSKKNGRVGQRLYYFIANKGDRK